MNYKDDIFNLIKPNNHQILDYNTLEFLLWYSYNTSSIQRDESYDNSSLATNTLDIFVLFKLVSIYKLECAYVFSDIKTCNASICSLPLSERNKSILYIALGGNGKKSSLFFNYYTKIRNSLAHGAFNIYRDIYYFLGQKNTEHNSEANFLLQTKQDIYKANQLLLGSFKNAIENPTLFMADCLQDFLGLKIANDEVTFVDKSVGIKYYSEKYGVYVYFNNSFHFETSDHVEEIRKLIMRYESSDETIVIVNVNYGNISERNRTSENGMVKLINPKGIIPYFKIENIKYLN